MQFVEKKHFRSAQVKSLPNLRCHVYFDPTTEKNMHNTQTQGWINPFRLMLPICHSGFSRSRQPIPHKLHGPLRTQNPRGSTTKSSCSVPTLQNRIPKKIVPPPTVIDHHKTTHDQIFWRLHLSFNFLLSKANAVYFFPKSKSRLFGLSPFAVTFGYAPMSIQLNCRE